MDGFCYECTCSATFATEANAVDHVFKFHTTREQRLDLAKLRTRVEIMISSLGSPFSWNQHFYEK